MRILSAVGKSAVGSWAAEEVESEGYKETWWEGVRKFKVSMNKKRKETKQLRNEGRRHGEHRSERGGQI